MDVRRPLLYAIGFLTFATPVKTGIVAQAAPRHETSDLFSAYRDAIFEQDGSVSLEVSEQAARIVRAGPLNLGQVMDLFDWMEHIEYINVYEGRIPRPASSVLRATKGDCKGHTSLFAAMVISIGGRVGIIDTGTVVVNSEGIPEGHVYTAVRLASHNRQREFPDIKEQTRSYLLERYHRDRDPHFFQTGEGLWLALDPTSPSASTFALDPSACLDMFALGNKGYALAVPSVSEPAPSNTVVVIAPLKADSPSKQSPTFTLAADPCAPERVARELDHKMRRMNCVSTGYKITDNTAYVHCKGREDAVAVGSMQCTNTDYRRIKRVRMR